MQIIQKPLETHMIVQHYTPRDGLNKIKKYPISLQNGMLVF